MRELGHRIGDFNGLDQMSMYCLSCQTTYALTCSCFEVLKGCQRYWMLSNYHKSSSIFTLSSYISCSNHDKMGKTPQLCSCISPPCNGTKRQFTCCHSSCCYQGRACSTVLFVSYYNVVLCTVHEMLIIWLIFCIRYFWKTRGLLVWSLSSMVQWCKSGQEKRSSYRLVWQDHLNYSCCLE